MTRPHRQRHPGHSLFATDKRARDAGHRSWLALGLSLLALAMAGAALAHEIVGSAG